MKTELERIEEKKRAFQIGGVLIVDSLTGEELNPEFELIDRGIKLGEIRPSREDVLIFQVMQGQRVTLNRCVC